MTPLAHRLTKEIIDGKHQDIKDDLADIHCFEIIGFNDLIEEMADSFAVGEADLDLVFLPFPKTWIEVEAYPTRFALLLEQKTGDLSHIWTLKKYCLNGIVGGTSFINTLESTAIFDDMGDYDLNSQGGSLHWLIYATISLINTPQNIGVRTHQAHKGLVRQSKAIDGFFPINAWTEINIQLGTRIHTGNGSYEIRQSSGKCLHWVRSFRRMKMGKIEIVKAHLRGDADLGFKQSRYIVGE